MPRRKATKPTSKRSKRIRFRAGDIFAIKVEEGLYGYAKFYRSSNIGVYEILSDHILDVDEVRSSNLIYWTVLVGHAVESGEWPIIGYEAFESEDATYPPARCIRDPHVVGRYQIYDKGNLRKATEEEAAGLDDFHFSYPEHVRQTIKERLVGRINVRKQNPK